MKTNDFFFFSLRFFFLLLNFTQSYQPWVIKTYGDLAKTKTITVKKHQRILKALGGHEQNNPDSSKFRFWVKAKGNMPLLSHAPTTPPAVCAFKSIRLEIHCKQSFPPVSLSVSLFAVIAPAPRHRTEKVSPLKSQQTSKRCPCSSNNTIYQHPVPNQAMILPRICMCRT